MAISPTGYYKILGVGGAPIHGGQGAYKVGLRHKAAGKLEPCVNGIHVVTLQQAMPWLGPAIHPVDEISDERFVAVGKTVARWVVLGPPNPTWNERTARLLACDCAEHVLSLWDARYPNDDRPRAAIDTARRYARGEATLATLQAARDACGISVGARARGAARNASWVAARKAAHAAWDTTITPWSWEPAWMPVVKKSTCEAQIASVTAAREAAWMARDALMADGDGAYRNEAQWQADRLASYIFGEHS